MVDAVFAFLPFYRFVCPCVKESEVEALHASRPRCIFVFPLLFAELIVHKGIERRVFTYYRLHDFAVRTNNYLRREALNSIVGEHVAVVGIIHMQPWHLVFLKSCEPPFLAFVAVDAQKLDVILVFIVVLFHLRDTANAPTAPCSPEVKHHVFAAKARQ